jgi:iron complex outermembrane recepter protein
MQCQSIYKGAQNMLREAAGFRLKPLTRLTLAALWAAGAQAAYAQSAATPGASAQISGDLGAVQSTAAADGAAATKSSQAKRESAPAQAPAQGSLKATEPQSIIDRHYIENNTTPSASYADIVNIAPSVETIDPSGPGLMEASKVSIRGFQDGQYNVTFDGIPFGDSNDFTHHSTSFFTSQQIGSVTVDRGPGEANQIGFATFGGTISVDSKDPSLTPGFTVLGSYGSWATALAGVEYNSGVMQNWGDARVMVGATYTDSNGALSNTPQRRQNIYFKLEKPLGADTLLTVYANYNNLHQNDSSGATAQQIKTFGPNFGLSGNPDSQAYYGYNFDKINTDFEYVDLRTRIAQWLIDNKVYTYAYYHNGFNGTDPNGETPNGTSFGKTDVPGIEMNNNYRAWGDILSAEHELGPGTLQLGTWITYQTNFRDKFNVDDTLNFAFLKWKYQMQDQFTTLEPYVQYEWKLPQYGLTITPGIRYVSFDRHIETPMNQTTGQPLDYSHDWDKALASATVHEQITSRWSAYFQFAQGFLAPNLNVLYVNNPTVSGQPDPEQTNNYQIGTVYKSERLTFDADLYYIDFLNAVTSETIGGETIFSNAGGAVYKGVETEGTFVLGEGFSLYGNLTFNSAKQKSTGDWMPNAPKMTAAAGLLYERGPLTGSAIMKFVGRSYGDVNDTQAIGGYAVTNLSLGYTVKNLSPWTRTTRFGLELDNVFNRTSINGLAGYTAADGTPLYWTIPGRAVFGTISTTF